MCSREALTTTEEQSLSQQRQLSTKNSNLDGNYLPKKRLIKPRLQLSIKLNEKQKQVGFQPEDQENDEKENYYDSEEEEIEDLSEFSDSDEEGGELDQALRKNITDRMVTIWMTKNYSRPMSPRSTAARSRACGAGLGPLLSLTDDGSNTSSA